jgi:pyruvate kinase
MKPDLRRKTKLVCTIGPSSESPRTVERLVRAGMSVARINLSHGDEAQHETYIRTVRTVAGRLAVPVAVLLDLPGPRYRTGELTGGEVRLKKGARLVLTSRRVPGDEHEVSVNSPYFVQDVAAGHNILLDDGAIALRVRQTTDTDVVSDVVVGGVLRPRRGIAVPGAKLHAPFFTQQVRRQVEFSAEHGVEYIALSYVTGPSDVAQVRDAMADVGGVSMVVAKVERREAVQRFDSILRASDGIMVARGDLGVEISLEKVPLVQKESIRKANRAGKPVITATQMLESMVNAPRPTRAEVADVANAIWDGTDAVMLSAETSIGGYPVEAAKMMYRILKQTEAALPYERMTVERGGDLEPQMDDAIAYAACHTAHQLGARAILAFTESGSTVWRVSKYRPRVPILAMTPSDHVRRILSLAWGASAHLVPRPTHVDDLFREGSAVAKSLGVAKEGDLVVVTGGIPVGVPGTTNLLKVHSV